MKRVSGTNKIAQCMLALFYTASFMLGGDAYHTEGYITMSITSIVIFICAVFRDGAKLHIQIRTFFLLSGLFLVHSLMTLIWAEDPTVSYYELKMIAAAIFSMFLLACYFHEDSVEKMLKMVMVGGYLVMLIVMRDQGFDTYLAAAVNGSRRYENDYINANILSMMLGTSAVITVYFVICKKIKRLWLICIVPASVIFLGAGSKSGFIYVIGSTLILVILRKLKIEDVLKKRLKSLLKLFLILVAVVLLLVYLSRLPLFSYMMSRFEGMFNLFSGAGKVDGSTLERQSFVLTGKKLFMSSPVVGIGVNNGVLHTGGHYLHSNIWEILAGMGIFGFLPYYSLYFYTFYYFWKFRKYRSEEYDLCLSIAVIRLFMDYFCVTYYLIDNWLYFVIFFTEVKHLKVIRQQELSNEEELLERALPTSGLD